MHLVPIIEFLSKTDELATARILLDTFAKYADTLQQYDELGMLYEKIKAYPESLKMLEKCQELAVDQNQRMAINANLAKVYNHVNDPDSSLKHSSLILQDNPSDPEALMERSFSYYLKGDSAESYRIQKKLLEFNPPKNVERRIRFNMGSFELARGDFKSGINNMITGGREIDIYPNITPPYLKWNGNKNTTATILVFAESGIGDEIIGIRFMRHFKQLGINAIWIDIRKDMAELFVRNGYNAVSSIDQIPKGPDYLYTQAMSLPILLDIDKDQLWHGPYLTPSQQHVDKWKQLLPERFITIRWSGNPYYDQDLHRSIDRELLVTSMKRFQLPMVSLQTDKLGEDNRLMDVSIESWEDTMAIQYLATMNVTSCTSTAHSASAIGAKCIVLPPIATYYPWLDLKLDNTSHWYGPNTVIFSQTKHKNWKETIDMAVSYMENKLR